MSTPPGKGTTAGGGGATAAGSNICVDSPAKTERGVECPDEGGFGTSVLLGERGGPSATTERGLERPGEGGLGTALAAADKA